MIYKKIFLLLFTFFYLNAADLNSTLIDANITVYKNLLQTISKQEKNEKNALQIILIKKIISLKETPFKSQNRLEIAKNINEYEKNFKTFLQWSENKILLLKDTKDLEDKLYILKSQIRMLDGNQSFTLNLQYALYKNQYDIKKRELKEVNKLILSSPPYFIKSLNNLNIDLNNTKNVLNKLEKDINDLDKKIEEYRLRRERYLLLKRDKRVSLIEKYIKQLQNSKKEFLKRELFYYFLIFSSALKEKNDEVFNLNQKMLKIASKIEKNSIFSNDLLYLFREMEKSFLGTVKTIQATTFISIKSSLKYFWLKINEPLFKINNISISIFKIILAFFVFILGFLIGNLYKKNIKKVFLKDFRVGHPTQILFANLGYYLIVIISFFIALNIMGIDLSSIALVAGALSVGIGFGLQNIVSNFISGIILMFERSIKIGDYIEIDEDLRGHITDIRMRSTTITTNSNIDVIVPNQDFIQNRVINWTMNDKIRRFEIPFSVAYGSDVHKVIDVVLDAVNKSNFKDVYNTPFRHTRVVFREMGDSSLNFELFVWIKGEGVFYPKRTVSRFLILIYDALNENNIEIPFPQRDIHIRSIEGEIPLKFVKK